MNITDSLDWTLIRTFLAVMELGSLSAAGRGLRLSQPTVGRHVKELEAQLDTVLFTRASRELVPTDLAQALLPRAQAMQEAAAGLSMIATGASAEIGGTVRVTASEVFSTYIMPQILGDLLQMQPALQMELVASNSNENLLRRDADVAVRMVRPTQNDLIMRKLGETPMGLFAHRDYLAQFGAPRDFADLGAHTFLGYDKSDLMIRGMAEMGIKAQASDFRFRCDNQIVQVEALKAGVGIGIAQVMIANRSPDLVQLLPDLPIPSLPVYVVAHRELHGSARVRMVYEHLSEAIIACIRAA